MLMSKMRHKENPPVKSAGIFPDEELNLFTTPTWLDGIDTGQERTAKISVLLPGRRTCRWAD